MQLPEPSNEHRWLQKLVGKWTSECEAQMDPDQPPMTFKGTETVRSAGGLWTVGEGDGEMPGGGRATTIMTLGYDPVKRRFVGTFIGSMMTHLWLYEGALDGAGRVLTLDTEGPSCAGTPEPGKMSRYKDAIEFKSDDHRVLTSAMRGDDGEWRTFMTAHYRRVK